MSTQKRWRDKSLVEKVDSWTTNTAAMFLSYAFVLAKWAVTGADPVEEYTRWGTVCLLWRFHRNIAAMEMGKWSTTDEVIAELSRELSQCHCDQEAR